MQRENLERCALTLGGEVSYISDQLVGIYFGVSEAFSLVFTGSQLEQACLIRNPTGVVDLEFAFRCNSMTFAKNPYGGKDECVQFWDDLLKFSPLTIIPMGTDRRHIWMRACAKMVPDAAVKSAELEKSDLNANAINAVVPEETQSGF